MNTRRKSIEGEFYKNQAVSVLSMMKRREPNFEDKMKKFVKRDKFIAKRTFETDVDGWTPVHACALKGSKRLLKVMLSSGIDVNFRMGQPEGLPKDCSLLHISAYRGDFKICKYLVSHGAFVDIQDSFSRTPLYYAIKKQHNCVVDMLKKHGADLSLVQDVTSDSVTDECPTPQPRALGFCFLTKFGS